MGIGKPHHLFDRHGDAVCGVPSPDYGTRDPAQVNCLRCRKTLVYHRMRLRNHRESTNEPEQSSPS
jgi:hypothetical protein